MMKRLGRKMGLILLVMLVLVQTGWAGQKLNIAEAANKELAQKPYMGWSSYSMQVYDSAGNWTSAESIKKQSDAMRDKLQSHGYNYINIDAGWNGDMDEYGRPIPSTKLYPNGFQEVIDYVHDNGQKIGIYLIPGLSIDAYKKDLEVYGTGGACRVRDIAEQPLKIVDAWNSYTYKIDFSNPCAQKYVDSIADMLGDWGIDFVKFDSVTPGSGNNNLNLDSRGDVKAWSEALARHDIWFEISWALDHNYVDFWKKYANGWRIQWDVEAYDSNVGLTQWANIARLFPDAAVWWRDAGPATGWNDFDSLNVGNGSMDGLTKDERQTAMTFWAISAAPLYIGNDMTRLDDYGLKLLTNDEVIAVNQAGRPAHPVSMDTQQQVWYANNGDGTYSVALFNLGSRSAEVKVSWKDIGLTGSAKVRDLWSHSELGTFDDGYAAVLEPHASRMFKVTAVQGTSAVNDDDTGIRYTGDWQRNGGYEQTPAVQNLAVTIKDSASIQGVGSEQDTGGVQPEAAGGAQPEGGEAVQSEEAGDGQQENAGGVQLDAASDIQPDGAGQSVAEQPDAAAGNQTSDSGEANSSSSDKSAADVPASAEATVTHSVYINDNDPGITYSGSWSSQGGRSAGDYKGDVHFTETDGDFFEYAFNGSGIDLITEKDPEQGDVDVYLDGAAEPETVSTYTEGSKQAQQVVYTLSGLAEGPHTIKAVKKTGKYMLLDALKVTASHLIDPVSASYDRESANPSDLTVNLTLGSGSLTAIQNGSDPLKKGIDYTVSGGTVTISKAYLAKQPEGPASLSFMFEGGDSEVLSVDIRGKAAQNSSIDPKETNFDKSAGQQQDLSVKLDLNGNTLTAVEYEGQALTENEYAVDQDTVTIKKEFLAGLPGDDIMLKFMFSAGDPQTLTVHITGAETVRYTTLNDDDPGIVYHGAWNRSTGRNFGDYKDDVHYTEANGDFFEHTFRGTGIQFFTEIDPSQGDMDIYLDGEFQKTVSSYSEQRQPQQKLYSVSGLKEGFHTLKVVKKSGRFMLVDMLKVEIPDLISPVSAVFDKSAANQKDVAVTLLQQPQLFSGITNGKNRLVEGTDYTVEGSRVILSKTYLAAQPAGTLQLAFTFGGDYQNDVHYTAANGDELAYTFKGTGVELAGPVGPAQGDIDVYVDGVLKKTVSAHSDQRLVLQPLYRITGLTDGTHTLRAVKKSGDLMLVDQLKFIVPAAGTGPVEPGTPNPPSGPSGPTAPGPGSSSGGSSSGAAAPPSTTEPGAQDDTPNERHTAYIQGYPGSTFRPDQPVTRAEMAAILSKAAQQAAGDKAGTAASTFRDVKDGFWAGKAIAAVTGAGLMKGYEDGTFKPEKAITRAEMATLASRLKPGPSAAGSSFRDTAGHWAESAIAKAQGAGILNGYPDGTFRPSKALTRAEAVTALNRALGRWPLYGTAALPWSDVPAEYWAYKDIAEASLDHPVKARKAGGEEWAGETVKQP
ncbi:S-layer homology domain-containing protein [Paenibacillus cellulositrophicus]|uniref:X2-like carbohydrate binding domain-containing protein n=1 Tax=Paenibacillus cellulositrophicus TaxID=562959 RepID=UPI00203E7AF4|nr:X2-like carbohydrate binding domain-containing protein [Paenibacillus cellulositrophicus]MCM2997161.1 S-layer homology domain-containing protein [Paenibacillus cellulositrophicus]